MRLVSKVRGWLDERFGWAELIAPLREKSVPIHKLSYWYFLGGITLFLFGIQVFTGILLLLYYRPSANEAFESVQYIMTRVRFGWLVRSIHSWAANLRRGSYKSGHAGRSCRDMAVGIGYEGGPFRCGACRHQVPFSANRSVEPVPNQRAWEVAGEGRYESGAVH